MSLPVRPTTSDPPPRPPTDAELEVASLLLRGLTHAAIARVRGTAKRTIVNQLGSLYRKLGCASRSDLVAHFSARRPAPSPTRSSHAKHVA